MACILFVGLANVSLTHAQTVSGAGTKNCRAFLQAAEMESKEAIDSYLSWSQGFVSGYNWANPARREVRLDHAGLMHWLLQYCTANPNEKFYQAVQSAIGLHAR
ncbi:MAG: hypothetical protein ACU84Q_09955 [Gammaproteobacteria bacterium]